jgi:hypothetical protein
VARLKGVANEQRRHVLYLVLLDDGSQMKKMQARNVALPIGAAVCLTLSLSTGCARQPKEPPKTVPVVEPAPGAAGSPASGIRAITPAASAQITETQVRSFVLSHHVPRAQATNLAIVSVSFITSEQVRSLLHSPKIGVPDQEPMCVVIMSGTFVFSGPPGHTVTYPIAVEVFDARTGNLMQSGGLARPPQAGAR